MEKFITRLMDLTGSGWKGYVGSLLMILAAIGCGADYIGEKFGMDVIKDFSMAWPFIVALFGKGLEGLGIRHKQSKQDEAIVAQTAATEEQTEAAEELTDALDSLPQKKR